MALPAIIVLLVVLALFGRSTALAMAVFGVLIAPGVFRLIRASVIAVREELYVDAARVSGLGDARIMRRHILPGGRRADHHPGRPSCSASRSSSRPAWSSSASARPTRPAGAGCSATPSRTSTPHRGLLLWPGLAIVADGHRLQPARQRAARRARRRRCRQPRARKRADVGPSGRGGPGRRAQAPPARPPAPDALLVVERPARGLPAAGRHESVVVDGVSLPVRRGRGPRPGRRVRLGQVARPRSRSSACSRPTRGSRRTGMPFGGQDLRGPVPGGDEPAARPPHRLHPAGADVQPRPVRSDRQPADRADAPAPRPVPAAAPSRGARAARRGSASPTRSASSTPTRTRSPAAWPSAC